jgi:hypothetical protein
VRRKTNFHLPIVPNANAPPTAQCVKHQWFVEIIAIVCVQSNQLLADLQRMSVPTDMPFLTPKHVVAHAPIHVKEPRCTPTMVIATLANAHRTTIAQIHLPYNLSCQKRHVCLNVIKLYCAQETKTTCRCKQQLQQTGRPLLRFFRPWPMMRNQSVNVDVNATQAPKKSATAKTRFSMHCLVLVIAQNAVRT